MARNNNSDAQTTNTDETKPALTNELAPSTPIAPGAPVIVPITPTTLRNLRAYAESGDGEGFAKYLDRATMLTLLDSYEHVHSVTDMGDRLQSATTQRDEARGVLVRLIDVLNDAARLR